MAHKLQLQDEEMLNIASMFRRFADTTDEHINKIKAQMDKLDGDGWIGLGWDSFKGEMDSIVMPMLQIQKMGFEEAERQCREIVNLFESYTQMMQQLFASL